MNYARDRWDYLREYGMWDSRRLRAHSGEQKQEVIHQDKGNEMLRDIRPAYLFDDLLKIPFKICLLIAPRTI